MEGIGIGEKSMDIKEILDILPHRYPFLMVDRILDYRKGEFITAIKNVTFNEPFFQGHFPGEPVMPGVMILEGLAQVGALLAYKSMEDEISGKIVYFAGIDRVRFRRVVRPGDRIVFKVEGVRMRPKLSKMSGMAYVDDELAVEAEIMAAFN
ncbi:MAG: 3-hydroxyacyl-ACP dehydratase FabZ [Desulfobulbaceae bacterium]